MMQRAHVQWEKAKGASVFHFAIVERMSFKQAHRCVITTDRYLAPCKKTIIGLKSLSPANGITPMQIAVKKIHLMKNMILDLSGQFLPYSSQVKIEGSWLIVLLLRWCKEVHRLLIYLSRIMCWELERVRKTPIENREKQESGGSSRA